MSAFYEMSEMTSSEFRDAARTIEIALVLVGYAQSMRAISATCVQLLHCSGG
jgi:hypothetical protein